MDGYSPMPVEGLAEAIGFTHNRIPLLVLIGGLTGAATAFAMMCFSAVINYPINVGGRGLNSWPAFVPITFELTILFGSFAAVFGMLGLNGLPMPYHPVFNSPGFAKASRSRFFLCIEARDPKFDPAATRGSSKAWAEAGGGGRRCRDRRDPESRKDRGCEPGPFRRRVGRPRASAAAWSLRPGVGRLQRAGHGHPAEVQAAPAEHVLRRRPVVGPVEPGTVARGPAQDEPAFDTGEVDGKLVGFIPLKGFDPSEKLDPAEAREARRTALERGRERYNIFCSPCHGRTGDGNGMIVQRGFSRPPSFHEPTGSARPRRALLPRDHQRLRRDVLVRLADPARRPLGDHRLRPGPATQPERRARRPARRPSGRSRPRRRARRNERDAPPPDGGRRPRCSTNEPARAGSARLRRLGLLAGTGGPGGLAGPGAGHARGTSSRPTWWRTSSSSAWASAAWRR